MIGVDIGTTSVKAIAFAIDGTAMATTRVAYPLQEPEPGTAIQDPTRVLEASMTALRTTAAATFNVTAVAFSAAMHSLIGVDAAGVPITPLLTWADNRAWRQAACLRIGHAYLHERTGTPMHPMAPIAKIIWWRETEPEQFSRVARWVGIKELVCAHLTGEWVVDTSSASGTGLADLATGDWDGEALAIAGIRRDQLSRIVPANTLLPLARTETGLPTGTPIVIGAGDGPSANLGVGAVGAGVVACSIGTSGALRVVVDAPVADAQRRVFCYALTPGHWVVGGAVNNGGSVLQWARAALALDIKAPVETQMFDLAATVSAGCDGLLMLPALLGERAPLWDGLARGAYVGLTQAHGRGHLIRAALEGVCQQLALVLQSLRDAGCPIHEIRATGGFAESPLWCQILADCFGRPIGFTTQTEGSALGAALIGMEAVGVIDSAIATAHDVRVVRTVEPIPGDAATYARLLPLHAALYDALAPTFTALRDGTVSSQPVRQ